MSDHQPASPGPAALAALAIICFAFFAVLTGRVPHEAVPILMAWGIGASFIQLVAGIMDLKHGDIVAGTTFFVFGAFFMLASGLEHIVEFWAHTANVHLVATTLKGWIWLCMTLVLIGLTPSFAVISSTFFITLVVADLGVLFVALMYLGILPAALASPVAGWLILIVGILGIYLMTAQVLNTALGKRVLPIGGPIIRRRSE